MPSGPTERADRLAPVVLVVAMVVSAALILVLGRDLTFWSDELDWLTFAGDFTPTHLLTPHNSHLIATTRVVYEGLPRIFGTDYLPFRILGIVSLQACAVLVFVLVRSRLGAAVAVLPAIVLLFFGSAQDMFISPLGIPFTLSIGLGLGALVAVERRSLGGDVLAMALLILSMLSHTFGTIVAVGLLVYYAVDRGRRRELWVPLIPLVLWIAWWLWARQFDQGITSASNLLGTPLFLVEAAGAALEGMLGIPPDSDVGSTLKIVFDLAAIAGAVLIAIRLATGRGTAWTWAYLATVLAFWAGIGLAEGDGREPDTPRYLFFGAIMIVLIAAEVFRDRVPPTRIYRWLLALALVCLIGNLSLLLRTAPDYARDADEVAAQLGALDASGGPFVANLRVADLGSPASDQIAAPAGGDRRFRGARSGRSGSASTRSAGSPRRFVAAPTSSSFAASASTRIRHSRPRAGSRTAGCVTARRGRTATRASSSSRASNVVELVRDTGAAGRSSTSGASPTSPTSRSASCARAARRWCCCPTTRSTIHGSARTTGAIRVCRIRCRGAEPADRGDSGVVAIAVLTYEYVEGILERRKPHREAHLARVSEFAAGRGLVVAGATGDPPSGALFVFEDDANPAAVAEAFMAGDPYVEAELVTVSRIEPWTVVANSWIEAPSDA